MKHKKKYIMLFAAHLVLVLSSCTVAKHDLSDGWIDIVAQGGESPPPVIRFRPIPHLEYFEMTEDVKKKIEARRKFFTEEKKAREEAREAARLKYLITKYCIAPKTLPCVPRGDKKMSSGSEPSEARSASSEAANCPDCASVFVTH